MKTLSTDDLDSFVAFVDGECNGNLRDSRVSEKFLPIQLVYKTSIDERLDPFGEEYFQSQIALYQEIAGKQLDQWSGELHPVNIVALMDCSNPQGNNDVNQVSENVRVLASVLSLSGLGSDARILDLGAGHGLSSEVYAFCGCRVHSIDIDPELSSLAIARAEKRSLRITRSVMNFDSLSSIENNSYQAAFFFQSLHHALRPWRLIRELKEKLSDDGVIAFSGEPIQSTWWKHWGIRLDEESLYVARKFGWFESGWSRDFISECFATSGLRLILLENGHDGGLIGITSKDADRTSAIIEKAARLGFASTQEGDIENSFQNFQSQIGRLTRNSLRASIRAMEKHGGGFLCFGPYISLPTGRYRVSFALRFVNEDWENPQGSVSAVFDIVSESGRVSHYRQTITRSRQERTWLIDVTFELARGANKLEARIKVPQPNEIWEMSLPLFERAASEPRLG